MKYIEPEYYPGTSTFVNLRGIQDRSKLESWESNCTFLRSIDLFQNPEILEKTFNFNHLKAIHHHLFQDVYSWAGCHRSYDLSKRGDVFTPADKIEFYENDVFSHAQNFYNLSSQPNFDNAVLMLSKSLGIINIYHPFPEGNGRTQRVFISTLAKEKGYDLDWKKTQNWEMMEVFKRVHEGNYEPLENVIRRILYTIST